ncbi:sulfite exporter TauE/SafE family protein [Pseudoalteromonas sp. OANN1]|uniref:sulfite exporter TauE/SafE family protein n=1 Tax=Pseudoalteromonas sp. OANN1 TaxID=2954497 RepID=UPI002096D6DF|nr:sulfite exporter TauE/SafE family protein [Pseudoalteromonas sp. OANN1]MCO7198961.1 sulfite exporter TauE/SafE family protein [Pseudoalteromonas sp. OANN1]
METIILIVVLCALLGCAVGFLAGLLGIGGGLLIVPILSVILTKFNVIPTDQVVLVAIATSLASIIFTSTSSAKAHHKNDNVPWHIAPWVMLGVAVGALGSGFAAVMLPEKLVRIIFVVSVVGIALKMAWSSRRPPQSTRVIPQGPILAMLTSVTGALSAMIGIGGGALIVPLLTFFSVDMKKAIGCASASGIVIAIFGSFGYIASGSQHVDIEHGFLGFVYLPALFGIVATSWFMAPIGAKATHHLPVTTIKKVFAALLIIIAGNMLMN